MRLVGEPLKSFAATTSRRTGRARIDPDPWRRTGDRSARGTSDDRRLSENGCCHLGRPTGARTVGAGSKVGFDRVLLEEAEATRRALSSFVDRLPSQVSALEAATLFDLPCRSELGETNLISGVIGARASMGWRRRAHSRLPPRWASLHDGRDPDVRRLERNHEVRGARFPLGEVMAGRSFSSLLICAAVVLPSTGLRAFATRRLGAHVARGLAQAISQTLTVIALWFMPLAGAIAIGFSAPSFATVISLVWLKERFDLPCLSALAAGSSAVLVVTRPGFGFARDRRRVRAHECGDVR